MEEINSENMYLTQRQAHQKNSKQNCMAICGY